MSEEDNIYIVTDRDIGSENGVASLVGGKVPETELPSYVDDVKEGYYYDSKFYSDAAHTQEIVPEADKIYIDLATNKTYRWSGSAYAMVGGDDPPVPIAPTTSSSGLGKPADAKLTGDALETKLDRINGVVSGDTRFCGEVTFVGDVVVSGGRAIEVYAASGSPALKLHSQNSGTASVVYADGANVTVTIPSETGTLARVLDLAPVFSGGRRYSAGDLVEYGGALYRCKEPYSGVWNSSYFEETTIEEAKAGKEYATLSSVVVDRSAWTFSPSTYNGYAVEMREAEDSQGFGPGIVFYVPYANGSQIATVSHPVDQYPDIASISWQSGSWAGSGILTAARTISTYYQLGTQSGKPLQPAGDYAVKSEVAAKMDRPSAPINSGAFALLTSSGNVVTSSVFPSTYVAKESTTIAIGTGTATSKDGDIAIGRSASGQGTNSGKATAVGYAAVASGRGASAFGDGAHAAGISAIAVGSGANASGNSAISIGSGATASGDSSVAVGRSAAALGIQSIAIGYLGAKSVTGTYSAQLGSPTTDLTENNTFRFRDTVVVNSSGKIPVANLDTVVVKTVNGNGPDSSGNAVVANVPQLKSSGSGLSTATITDSGTIDMKVPPPSGEYHGDWKDVTFSGWDYCYYVSGDSYCEVGAGDTITLISGSGTYAYSDFVIASSGSLVGAAPNPVRFYETAWPGIWYPRGQTPTGDPSDDVYPLNIESTWHYCGSAGVIYSPGHYLQFEVSNFDTEYPSVYPPSGQGYDFPSYVNISGSIHVNSMGSIAGGTRERGSVTKTVATTDQIPTVPTKLSQLNNDAGYITATRLPYTFKTATSVLYDRSINSVSVSSGTSSLDLELPLQSGYSRDFMVRLCTADTSLLTVTFKESTSGYSVFEAGKTYSVGNRCASGNSLYECTTAHSGAWNASHFKMVTADVEIGGSELADWNKAGTHLVMMTEIAKDKWFAGKRFEASA